MSSSHHKATAPVGRVESTSVLFGGISLLLAFVVQSLGLLASLDEKLLTFLTEKVFFIDAPAQLSLPVLFLLTAVFCFGITFAILDSSGVWRRVILGVSALAVVCAMVPALAVWKIYLSPFMPLVGTFWAWVCASVYASSHRMPCDVTPVKN